MEREARRAVPAGREENNHLNDCWTFRMGRERGSWQQEGRRGNKRFSSVAEGE